MVHESVIDGVDAQSVMTTKPQAKVNLEPSWLTLLAPEFEKPYMRALSDFLKKEKQAGKIIYPQSGDIFRAFWETPFDAVKVVIVGQDPYHGPGQAQGLCFSVPEGVSLPPSLVNIYKELYSDCGVFPSKNGSLLKWAKQGVLLLNSVLTVEQHLAASHQGKGWEKFTDRVIALLNEKKKNLVFVLWGAYAQKKGAVIDRSVHHVIESVHPSPLSVHRGFFGSKPFSSINDYLKSRNIHPIDWS